MMTMTNFDNDHIVDDEWHMIVCLRLSYAIVLELKADRSCCCAVYRRTILLIL
eukprot:CAMPEP_0198220862 /NCGR_PEP_ID=MMETSP1445-20131203/81059_1 /TAXON_ID=36898 /ORGANISM="Pyramimonas sp., Strain CCMP2087" /LENGTH=52 /DNA_ID=CAMNT_0043898787 /DNA_START=1 /DNA_END=156 /DNA_ORIENTATION=-